jgi:hypothetical protein
VRHLQDKPSPEHKYDKQATSDTPFCICRYGYGIVVVLLAAAVDELQHKHKLATASAPSWKQLMRLYCARLLC